MHKTRESELNIAKLQTPFRVEIFFFFFFMDVIARSHGGRPHDHILGRAEAGLASVRPAMASSGIKTPPARESKTERERSPSSNPVVALPAPPEFSLMAQRTPLLCMMWFHCGGAQGRARSASPVRVPLRWDGVQ